MTNAGLTAATAMINAASAAISGGYTVYRGPEAIENVAYPLVLLKTIQELDWGQFNITSGTIFASIVDDFTGENTNTNDVDDAMAAHGDRLYALVKALSQLQQATGYLVDARFSIVDEIQIDRESNHPTIWGNFIIKYGLQE